MTLQQKKTAALKDLNIDSNNAFNLDTNKFIDLETEFKKKKFLTHPIADTSIIHFNSQITFPFELKQQLNISGNFDREFLKELNKKKRNKRLFSLEDEINSDYLDLINKEQIVLEEEKRKKEKERSTLISEIQELDKLSVFYEIVKNSSKEVFLKTTTNKTSLEKRFPISNPKYQLLSPDLAEILLEIKNLTALRSEPKPQYQEPLVVEEKPIVVHNNQETYTQEDIAHLSLLSSLDKKPPLSFFTRGKYSLISNLHFYEDFDHTRNINPETFLSFVFPSINDEIEEIELLINKYADIYYLQHDDHRLVYSELEQQYFYLSDEEFKAQQSSDND